MSLPEAAEGLTRDDILDNITITWLTNTALSGARLYWENKVRVSSVSKASSIPVAVSVFSGRTLSVPAELGGAGVSQTDPLQQAPQGRALCGLGTAEALFRRGSRGLQIIAVGRGSGCRIT